MTCYQKIQSANQVFASIQRCDILSAYPVMALIGWCKNSHLPWSLSIYYHSHMCQPNNMDWFTPLFLPLMEFANNYIRVHRVVSREQQSTLERGKICTTVREYLTEWEVHWWRILVLMNSSTRELRQGPCAFHLFALASWVCGLFWLIPSWLWKSYCCSKHNFSSQLYPKWAKASFFNQGIKSFSKGPWENLPLFLVSNS